MFPIRWISTLCCVLYHLQATVTAADAVQLDLLMDCFIERHYQGYLTSYPLRCQCRQSGQGPEGELQWFYADGTRAPDENYYSSKVLVLHAPILYEKTHVFTCSLVSPSGEKLSTVEYANKFTFGPHSAELRRADTSSNGVHYICPGETVEETVYCEVPLDTTSPDFANFRLYVDGESIPLTSPGQMLGTPIEGSNVIRQELSVELTTLGAHFVFCEVTNYYTAGYKASATLEVFVLEKANCP